MFESIARQAVELRTTSPWCRDVDEDIFIHFVATPRVNNEPFVDSWPILRKELAERIAGMSAHDAVLETNYWCCETATYQTADERTLGPLGMLASGNGRCGEESTYLVTALRANGIPARQIYTPLWAHCDDNHAWVEAYVDGEWYYLAPASPKRRLTAVGSPPPPDAPCWCTPACSPTTAAILSVIAASSRAKAVRSS